MKTNFYGKICKPSQKALVEESFFKILAVAKAMIVFTFNFIYSRFHWGKKRRSLELFFKDENLVRKALFWKACYRLWGGRERTGRWERGYYTSTYLVSLLLWIWGWEEAEGTLWLIWRFKAFTLNSFTFLKVKFGPCAYYMWIWESGLYAIWHQASLGLWNLSGSMMRTQNKL